MTVAIAIREGTAVLEATSDTPRLDAEVLMAALLGMPRGEMLLRMMDTPVPSGYPALVMRRARHEPVAHITGRQEFFGLDFAVSADVLIPRADSEVLVEAALHARPEARRLLDCGTGSGALLLAALANLPDAAGTGIDRSSAALEIASANAAALGLAARAHFVCADWDQPGWTDALAGPFDLVLANPPYVETGAPLAPSVREYEPAGALFAGADGLDAYRRLLPQLRGLMTPGAAALVEIGAEQADSAGALARANGFAVTLHRDLAGRPRVLECVQNC